MCRIRLWFRCFCSGFDKWGLHWVSNFQLPGTPWKKERKTKKHETALSLHSSSAVVEGFKESQLGKLDWPADSLPNNNEQPSKFNLIISENEMFSHFPLNVNTTTFWVIQDHRDFHDDGHLEDKNENPLPVFLRCHLKSIGGEISPGTASYI